MPRLVGLLLALLVSLAAHPAWAATKNPFSVAVEGLTLAPGASGAVRITVVVPPKHHVYRDMMEVTVVGAGGLTLGTPSFPVGQQKDDPANPGSMREQYDIDVIIEVPTTAPAAAGSYTAEFDVRYQGCKESLCYMPTTERVSAVVQVVEGAAPASGAATPTAPDAIPAEVLKVSPGDAESGELVVNLEVIEGWHVNRDLMGVRLAQEGGPVTIGAELGLPPGVPYHDPATGMSRTDLDGTFTLRAPVSGPDGTYKLDLLVSYQACKEALCLMPQDAPVTVEVTLGGAVATAAGDAGTSGPVPVSQGDMFTRAREAGLGRLLLLVFTAGLGVSLTPCVLPMVPITIGIIGARSAGSRVQAIGLSATYVAGLALVYSSLGVAAGMTGMMFGGWMQSVWVVGAIGIFFFFMGLAMFGLFDLGVPSSIQTRLSQYGGSGFSGALVVGMVGALVAGPCSGPVLLAIIALISTQGEVGLGALLMLVFSLGMGMIFLVAGAFSSSLLRPGPWMDTVKKSFGLPMWAGALYFVSPHLPEGITALVAALMLLVTAVFAWPESEEEHGFWVARTRKLYSVVAGLVGGSLLLGALTTLGLLRGPALAGASTSEERAAVAKIPWGSDEPAALAAAASGARPVVIDFTADWCAACKELEHLTYTDARVIAAAARMVPVMIDVTNDKDPVNKALLEKYGVRGLPTVKFLDPSGAPMEDLTVTGFLPADEFLPHMNAALQRAGG